MTVSSSIAARCNVSRKTLLAVAAVSVAGAVVVAATRARGRKRGKTSEEDMTSSSTSTTLSDKQCKESWSEQIEAEEVEGEHKSAVGEDTEAERLSTQLGKLKVRSGSSAMTRRAKSPVSVNCPDEAPAKATDSGVVSPVGNGAGPDMEFVSKKQRSESSDSGGSSASVSLSSSSSSVLHSHSHNQHNMQHNGDGAFSDSGQGSEPDDGTIMCYQFKLPCYITGKLIGHGGQFIKSVKALSRCHIDIEKNRDRGKPTQIQEFQTVMLEGTRSQIDKCLEMIRERFHREIRHQEVSLEQINSSTASLLGAPQSQFPTPQHALMSSNVLPVFVSALESGTHIFVQQPGHHTFHQIHRLEECMNHVYGGGADSAKQYGDCSLAESELQELLVCVCRSEEKWYRIQLVSKAEDNEEDDNGKGGSSSKWCCRFLDVGGYGWVEAADLRKIRSDFLELPFQAIECCLANVAPRESVDEFAGAEALRDLTQNKNCFVRLNHFEEGSLPLVDLYYQSGEPTAAEDTPRHVLVNRELVNLGLMNWFENIAPAAPAATDDPLV